MNKISSIWRDEFPPYPVQDLNQISDVAISTQREVCCCFFLYRYLHRHSTPRTTLAGDYCFARFSKYLAELDNVPLTDAFAEYLREDTADSKTMDSYLQFVSKLPAVAGHGA